MNTSTVSDHTDSAVMYTDSVIAVLYQSWMCFVPDGGCLSFPVIELNVANWHLTRIAAACLTITSICNIV